MDNGCMTNLTWKAEASGNTPLGLESLLPDSLESLHIYPFRDNRFLDGKLSSLIMPKPRIPRVIRVTWRGSFSRIIPPGWETKIEDGNMGFM